jgi:hypothetical protein
MVVSGFSRALNTAIKSAKVVALSPRRCTTGWRYAKKAAAEV